MKLLMDTHIWLWRELDPAFVPPRAALALTEPANELWLSPLSTWEMARLAERGRIRLDQDWPDWLTTCWNRNDYREAVLTRRLVSETSAIELEHSDPMDWLLAATARYYRLTLVTADAQLLSGSGYEVLRLN